MRFERTPEGRATDLTITMQYEPPGGRLGTWVAKALGEDPERKIDDDLQRFKESMESEAFTAR